MPNKPTLLLTLAAIVLGLSTPVQAAKQGDQFKDWIITCIKPDGEEKEVCQAAQSLSETEDSKPILQIQVGLLPGEEKQPAAVITLPLGIALRPGIQLKVDEGESFNAPIGVCLPAGCQTMIKIDEDLLWKLKKGKKFYVAFYPLMQEARAVGISLSGFTMAYESLLED